MDRTRVFVEPPTDLIFLCGGKTGKPVGKLLSIRDAFLKIPDNPALEGRKILLAEKVNTFHLSRPAYADLLRFEIDFAQICELVLLFSESQGSIAELGAFSMVPEIASKMLVVVRDYHLKEDSFIKLGPVQHLKLEHGEHSLFILNDADTGMSKTSIKNVDLDVLRDRLTPAINDRFQAVKEKVTFDRDRRGHLIKFMVGFVQEFGGLTAAELVMILTEFEVNLDVNEVDKLMLCAEAAKWVVRDQRGFETYYFALPGTKDAIVLKFAKGSPVFNKVRRRQDFRDAWAKTDQQRMSGIKQFAGGTL